MKACLLVMAILGLSATILHADDWTHWRGPDSNGITKTTTVSPNAFAPQPRVVWKAALGWGYASPSIKDGLLYCLGNANGKDTVVCLKADTGAVVWKYSYTCALGSYPGPKATPTVSGSLVYTMSRDGQMFAFNAATGAVAWKRSLRGDFGESMPDFDFWHPPSYTATCSS
jgi:outer membrane protein assembly factor BamB